MGYYSKPLFGDLDRDGDLDLVAGHEGGGFAYYENTGGASSAAFAARTGVANPFAGLYVGFHSTGSLGDLDRDGDLDLVTGAGYGSFTAFENTGSAIAPAFVARNTLAGQDVGVRSTPALGDLDGDGDADLVAGEAEGVVNFADNRGGDLASVSGSANPLAGMDVGSYAAPALGDLDGDGDLDLVAGASDGVFHYFRNTGSATSPAFAAVANPLAGQDVGDHSTPALGDLDGDLDLIAGEFAGVLNYFENTGSAASPAFAARTGAANPVNFFIGERSSPALGDLDADGDLDLIVGERVDSDGVFNYFENLGSATNPVFGENPTSNPFAGHSQGSSTFVSLGDLDGDGDLDAAGSDSGLFVFYQNTGGATSPAFVAGLRVVFVGRAPSLGDLDVVAGSGGNFLYFESFVVQSPPAVELTGAANPLDGQDVGSLAAPALADLDRDGDPDLVAGEAFGAFRFFENTGSAIAAAFLAHTGSANPLNGRDVGDDAKPALGDLDGDGDFDLLVGRLAGDFRYFANTGAASTPLFAAPVANPFGLGDVGSNSAPALGDLDADGDLDLGVGAYYGGFVYFENTGSRTNPAFAARTGVANPLAGLDPSYYATPALGDFDVDGDLDVACGNESGRFRYFQNAGFEPVFGTDLLFTRLTGSANPLAGEDMGDFSAPAAADLDGDGDADLVTGSLAGTFAVHYFPEPGRGLLLGAGIALLSLLERLRRR